MIAGFSRARESATGSHFRLVRVAFVAAWLLACGARTGLMEAPEAGGAGTGASGAPAVAGAPNIAGAPAAGAGGAASALMLDCPSGPDDPRLPQLPLGTAAPIDGTRFVSGPVTSWHWELLREDCDAVVANPEFVLEGANEPRLIFQALRPAPYHFTLTVQGAAGDSGSCQFEVSTQNRGMRVELCWNTSQNADLDLYLHNPSDQAPWYTPGASSVSSGLNGSTCNVANCTANLRLGLPRANFGYADSPLADCEAGPAATEFKTLGRCPNPRAGEDNNQMLATGVAERVQLDNPRGEETFRVMVQNYGNNVAEPHVFVYCAGKKAAEATPPTFPQGFVAFNVGRFGVMWRAADVTPHVNANGDTSGCSVTFPASPNGTVPFVTINDSSY
jgi:hypothetical protein